MTAPSVHVRLPIEAYDALATYAAIHRLTLGAAAGSLIQDAIFGRARGMSVPARKAKGKK